MSAARTLPATRKHPHPAPLPLLFQTHGAVYEAVSTPVLLFSIYACFIYLLDLFNIAPNLGAGGSSLSAVLSAITGLMVSYRSGSSSERWHDGRKLWSGLTATSRTLLRTLSIALPELGSEHDGAVCDVLGLVVALPYALKHHLRDQDPLSSSSFQNFLPATFRSDLQNTRLPRLEGPDDNEVSRSLNAMNDDTRQDIDVRKGSVNGRNVPLMVVKELHQRLVSLSKTRHGQDSPLLDGLNLGICLQCLKEASGAITECERIKDTPIPVVLSIHLQQMLFFYLLAIPPSLVKTLGIFTIPATAIATFTYFGVDRAAEQLSDPFGQEANDLPLDRFVADIEADYREYVGNARAPVYQKEEKKQL